MENCIYVLDGTKEAIKKLEKIKKILKKSKELYDYSDIVIEDCEFAVLRVNMRDGYIANVTFNSGERPYNIELKFAGLDSSVRNIWSISERDVYRRLLKIEEDIKEWVLSERNNVNDMSSVVKREKEQAENRRNLHNALLTAKFGFPRIEGLKYLENHRLKSADYKFVDGHFYDIRTNEVVYKLYD